MKGKNNIHKFPTNHARLSREAYWENKTYNSGDSVDLESMPVAGKGKSKKIKYIWIWEGIVGCIWFAALFFTSIYAGKVYNFLSDFADTLKDFWAGIVGSVVAVLCTTVAKKARFAHYAGIFFCANVLFALFLCSLKWKAIELDKSSIENLPVGEIASSAISAPVEVSGAEVNYSKPYMRDADIFVEDLELYCGVEKESIAEEDEAEERANIIEKDINVSRKDREGKIKSQLFWDNWNRADYLFRSYDKQRVILKEDMNTSLKDDKDYLSDIREYRIRDLKEAINYRILANEQYEDAENQKLLAQYYIGLADEYISQKSYSLALKNLQEGAEWAAKSIYNAIIEDDKNKMRKGMTELNEVISRLEQMRENETISEDIISIVKDGRDAYQVLIERQ